MARGSGYQSIDQLPQTILDLNRAVLGLDSPVPAKPAKPAPPPAASHLRLHLDGRFLTQIQRVARREGWQGFHTYNALGADDSGLHAILVRDVVIFAEIKDDGADLTEKQAHWHAALTQVGCGHIETVIWTPKMWPAIEARLTQPKRG